MKIFCVRPCDREAGRRLRANNWRAEIFGAARFAQAGNPPGPNACSLGQKATLPEATACAESRQAQGERCLGR
eukprot:2667438-Pyramimonas_sp.AAC.1